MREVARCVGARIAAALLLALAAPSAAQALVPAGTVVTIAGTGSAGFSGDDGLATAAAVGAAYGCAVGPDGAVYFVAPGHFRIRRIDPVTGQIATIAGIGPPPGGFLEDGPNGDGGPATSAQIGNGFTIAIDRALDRLFLADWGLYRVRQVDLATGLIDNFAGIGAFDDELGFEDGDGGPAVQAYVPLPFGVAVGLGSDVLITDSATPYRLRRVDGATGIISRIAGIEDESGFPVNLTAGDGGLAAEASFSDVRQITVDSAGNVYVLDFQGAGEFRVRRVDAATGTIDTIAGGGTTTPGSGPATEMRLVNAQGGDLLVHGGTLFVATGSQVLQVDLATGQLAPFAGTGMPGFSGDGGDALDARFDGITGLALVPGGGLVVADANNGRVRYIAPATVDLSGDGSQTELNLPWVSELPGDLTVADNPNVTVIDLGSLTTVTGSISIENNTAATVIDMGSLTTATGSISIGGNTVATVIDLASLTGTTGSISVEGNTAATVIDMGSVTTATGSISIGGNTAATVIDLASLTGTTGSISVEGNTAATVIDMGSLTTATGDVVIADNGSATVTDMSATVTGNVDIETTGTGTYDASGADVTGNTTITTDGYSEVDAATADGQTAVTMINGPATMELVLPAGAFSIGDPVLFSVQQLAGDPVESWGEGPVTTLAEYRFQFDIATLGQDATLNFEIDLASLGPVAQAALLDLLHAEAPITLAVQGDAPGAALQLFDVCAAGVDPTPDGCADVLWLDASRTQLEPSGAVDPALLRFEALVGHFSSYSVVVPEPGAEPLLAAAGAALASIAAQRRSVPG